LVVIEPGSAIAFAQVPACPRATHACGLPSLSSYVPPIAQSADGAHDTAETVLLVLVSADRPGTAAAFAQCPSTGGVTAAAAGFATTALVAPISASEAPATVTPTNILILEMLMPVSVAAGAGTPLKRPETAAIPGSRAAGGEPGCGLMRNVQG
jgi:hypothetical protein